MRAIAKWSRLGVFTLTEPILFRLLAFESQGSICDLEFDISMSCITEWLSSTPATRAPHVGSSSLTFVLQWQLAMHVAGAHGIQSLYCLVREGLHDWHRGFAFGRGHR